MIKSVIKAINIMSLFSPEEPRLSLAEISSRLGMPKSTAHNLLNTLLSEGYIEQVDNDYYALGTKIIGLTQNVRVNVELRDRAAPLLRAVADSSRESVYLTVRDGSQVLYIYAIESSQRLMARSAIGGYAPLYCTSVGKAILSQLPSSELDAFIADTTFQAFTPATIADEETLRHDLQDTRERGYSIDNQEHETGIYCLGAPIFDMRGRVIGACSISGTDTQIIDGRQDELAAAVRQTAEEISRRMGYVPATVSSMNRRTGQ